MDNGHPKDLDAVLEKVKDSKYITVVCIFYVQKCPPFFPSLKGSFPLAEWNKISGFFSYTLLGSGYRSCDLKADSCFCCVCHS